MSSSAPAARGEITDAEDIKRFLGGNKAVFTLESVLTGKHLTFRLEGDQVYWLPQGLEGRAEWVGSVAEDRSRVTVSRGPGMLPVPLQPWRGAIPWLWQQLYSSAASKLEQVRFFHEGACSRCGRPLTNPESIRRGIGPVCYERAIGG